MKKIIGLVLIVLMLVGCSSGSKADTSKVKEGVLVATLENGPIKMVQTYDGDKEKDILTKMVQTSTIDLSALTQDQKDKLEKDIEVVKEQYSKIKGATYTFEIKDNKATEVVTLSLEGDALQDVVKNKVMVGMEDTDQTYSHVSYKLTLENLKKQGFTVEE